ncbi:Retrovirus-related Pol poly from transposon, partial [Paramuricea clavata]
SDACDTGIGAVLSQRHGEDEKVIAYAARSLSKTERNYRKPFKARSDHNALRWIRNFKQPKGQVARWIERLSVFFYFKIEHRPGRSHRNADGVSRIPQDTREVQTGHVCNASNGNAKRARGVSAGQRRN